MIICTKLCAMRMTQNVLHSVPFSILLSLHAFLILCVSPMLSCLHCHTQSVPSSYEHLRLPLSKFCCSALSLVNLFILHNHTADLPGEKFPFFLWPGQALLFHHFIVLNIFPFPCFRLHIYLCHFWIYFCHIPKL